MFFSSQQRFSSLPCSSTLATRRAHTYTLQAYEIVSVNQAQSLANRLWTDRNNHSWRWTDALKNAQLATDIFNWQLAHHLRLRRNAVAAEVLCLLCPPPLRLAMLTLSFQTKPLKLEITTLKHTNADLRSRLAAAQADLETEQPQPRSPNKKRKSTPPTTPPRSPKRQHPDMVPPALPTPP